MERRGKRLAALPLHARSIPVLPRISTVTKLRNGNVKLTIGRAFAVIKPFRGFV